VFLHGGVDSQDRHRLDRRGFPEAVSGAGKTGREIGKNIYRFGGTESFWQPEQLRKEFAIVQQHHPDGQDYLAP